MGAKLGRRFLIQPSGKLEFVIVSPTQFCIWQKTGCGMGYFLFSKQKTGNAGY